ncbi:MAG: glutamine--fructose-6-phosphate transaminase (isomerizing) [Thermodesulfovibrionales bacterium]
MCGIIGYIGKKDAISVVLDGLKRLEYRGYDSAGIAYLTDTGIEIKRCKGKVRDLFSAIGNERPVSNIAIGHTRWATHGRPSEENAHPHRSGGIAIVHNGIIENYVELKKELISEGYSFNSETDTEVICHLIHKYARSLSLEDAVRKALSELKGAYAIAVISENDDKKIIGARKDSPLCLGIGNGEYFVASDVPAFFEYSKDVIFLEDGDIVIVTEDGFKVIDMKGNILDRKITSISWSPSMAEKGGFKHFMLKEIYEQPRAIADTIRGRIDLGRGDINVEEFGLDNDYLKSLKRVFIVACGTSWHAGLIGKYMIEEMARIPVEVDIASEFRYRNPIIAQDDLLIAITQSGETADTLAAQREAKKRGARVLSICNVIGSTSSREADSVFYTHSGPEIGVASTKAFTSQIVALYLFSIALSLSRKNISSSECLKRLNELLTIPDKIERILKNDGKIEGIARIFFKSKDFLYLGRGIYYPVALEGALKLKEISYIHAEGYPAGEMKHGPIALIDEEVPVVFLAPKGILQDKIISNIEEVRSRGGRIIALTNEQDDRVSSISDYSLVIPESDHYLSTILFTIPLQLLAYHTGVMRGYDVDQPRNLAKSVTVE